MRRATAADQAKTSFLRSMSHDIRTPINIIMGMLEIIGREPDNRAQIQECRSKAQTASRYLLELVNDVLTLNRPEEKAALEAQTPFSLWAELGDVLLLAREQAKAAGVVLAEPELLLAHDNFTGNPLYLRQVCQNIIGNAIKYSRPGGQVRCTFREQEDSDGVCRLRFTCQDDGVGMTPEQLETILDKKESDAESTKIGVYNVNERLQLFFGPDAVMKYYSTPGVRTMVMLVLPIVRGKEEDSHAED